MLTAASRASCGDIAASSLGGGCRRPTAPAAVAGEWRGRGPRAAALRCSVDPGMLLGRNRAGAELCSAVESTCDIATGGSMLVWPPGAVGMTDPRSKKTARSIWAVRRDSAAIVLREGAAVLVFSIGVSVLLHCIFNFHHCSMRVNCKCKR